MKPALSPHTTGFLPTLRTSSLTSARTWSSVTTVRMISTSPWTGAGLKKCTPMTRPGWELAVEMSVTESDEVLVARIASGATIESSSRKICFLTSTDSTTASTTKSASVRSLSSVVKVIRPSRSACSSSVIFWRLTARFGGVLEVLPSAGRGLVVLVDADDRVALPGEHLRDTGTHGAQTDDPDGVEGASGGHFGRCFSHGPKAS